MLAVTITIPAVPQPKIDPTTKTTIPVTLIEECLWKEDNKKMTARKDKYNKNMPKAHIIIYNQCSNRLKNDFEASNSFQAVNACQDPIVLLKIIRGLCCSYDSKTQIVMVTVASHKRLFTYFQRDGVDNSTYHREFMAHTETIETYGGLGAVGIILTFLAQKMKDMHKEVTLADPDAPTDDERVEAMKAVREEFLGVLMLSGANRDKYSALKNELANQYCFGNDLYPKSVDQCLTMLNRCTDNPTRPQPCPQHPPKTPPKAEDKVLVFAQGSDKKPVAKSSDDAPSSKSPSSKLSNRCTVTKVMCRKCGKLGHMSSVFPDKKKPSPDPCHGDQTRQSI
jgi:hypothetical protein